MDYYCRSLLHLVLHSLFVPTMMPIGKLIKMTDVLLLTRASIFGSNLISRSSEKQQLVVRSSIEADYRCMANTTAELLRLQSLIQILRVPFHTPTVLCDNLSAVALTHNPTLHSCTKHNYILLEKMSLQYNYIFSMCLPLIS